MYHYRPFCLQHLHHNLIRSCSFAVFRLTTEAVLKGHTESSSVWSSTVDGSQFKSKINSGFQHCNTQLSLLQLAMLQRWMVLQSCLCLTVFSRCPLATIPSCGLHLCSCAIHQRSLFHFSSFCRFVLSVLFCLCCICELSHSSCIKSMLSSMLFVVPFFLSVSANSFC